MGSHIRRCGQLLSAFLFKAFPYFQYFRNLANAANFCKTLLDKGVGTLSPIFGPNLDFVTQ